MPDYRDFKIGDKVWKPKDSGIVEGVIVTTKKVSFTNQGTMYDDPNGKYTAFVARFGPPNKVNDLYYDWEEQWLSISTYNKLPGVVIKYGSVKDGTGRWGYFIQSLNDPLDVYVLPFKVRNN